MEQQERQEKREEKQELEQELEEFKPFDRRIAVILVVVIIAIGLVLVVLDWQKVQQVLVQADWKLILPALAFTAISYSCLSYTFVLVNQTFGLVVSRRDLFEISLVTVIMNHLITAGGAAGYGVRVMMLRERGAAVKDITAATIFHIYLDGLGMLFLLPVGLVYLLLKHPFAPGATIGIEIATAVLFLVFVLASALILVPSLRARILRLAVAIVDRVAHRDIEAGIEEFDASMTRGVAAIRHKPLLAVALVVLTIFDWTASMTALWFCFDALGDPLSFEVLLAGFSIGLTAGSLSMVPGGLGVQEGSMAGIYALLGTPFQQAVLAAILFRVVYYFIPYIISLAFYGRLLQHAEGESP
ncbi:MAG: flippase-like domain-containing protein [Anaerolineae bacterium]